MGSTVSSDLNAINCGNNCGDNESAGCSYRKSCGPGSATVDSTPYPEATDASRRIPSAVGTNPDDLIPMMTLHKLCAAGSISGVSATLEQGQAGVNQADSRGRTALHFAAARGDIAMIQVLLRYGGRIDVRDDDGKTPLTLAAELCDGDVVRYLLAVQRAAQHSCSISPAYTQDKGSSASPANNMQQHPEYQQILLQQRQQQLHLLERVSGRAQSRSSPTQGRNSPHSAASTEVGSGIKKQEDNLSNPALDSNDAEATPAVTTLEETQDFEYTLVGRMPHKKITDVDQEDVIVTRNYAILADYTSFPNPEMSPGAYERAKRLNISKEYRRVGNNIQSTQLRTQLHRSNVGKSYGKYTITKVDDFKNSTGDIVNASPSSRTPSPGFLESPSQARQGVMSHVAGDWTSPSRKGVSVAEHAWTEVRWTDVVPSNLEQRTVLEKEARDRAIELEGIRPDTPTVTPIIDADSLNDYLHPAAGDLTAIL